MRADRLRAVLQRRMDALFDHVDVLVAAWPDVSPPLPARFGDGPDLPSWLTWQANCSGLPGVVVPCGFTAAGLPIGLQLVARALDDGLALAAAHLYQQKTDWHRRHPPLAA